MPVPGSVAAATVAAMLSLALVAGACVAVPDATRATSTPAPTATPAPTSTPVPTPTPRFVLPPNPERLHRWRAGDLPVAFCIDTASQGWLSIDEFEQAVVAAFDVWGVPFADEGPCAAPRRFGDGVNAIGWGTLAGSTGDGYEAGLTHFEFEECATPCDDDADGALTEADITIDADPPRAFRDEECLASTLLHEAGHFLGLEHLPPPAVMQPETSDCPLHLTDADLDALYQRYGDAAHPRAE